MAQWSTEMLVDIDSCRVILLMMIENMKHKIAPKKIQQI